jgi:class 3 adenylate cyclase
VAAGGLGRGVAQRDAQVSLVAVARPRYEGRECPSGQLVVCRAAAQLHARRVPVHRESREPVSVLLVRGFCRVRAVLEPNAESDDRPGGSRCSGRHGQDRGHNGQMGLPSGAVTLLFTDVEGSIRLWEADRETMAEASARYSMLVREQMEAAGGQVFKTAGETFRAVFADPPAALASALTIQQAAGTGPWPPGLPIRVRIVLHPGACAERDGDYLGPVVSRAARLLAADHGGQVLMSGAACELLAGRLPGGVGLEDLGEHHLKDPGVLSGSSR